MLSIFPDARWGATNCRLELQSCFARCIGQSLDAAVIEVAAAIEDHLLDSLLLSALGNQLANFLRGSHVAAVVLLLAFLPNEEAETIVTPLGSSMTWV